MPFFSLFIPFFISCWFWTAAPVCCLVWCVWQQAACRRERLLAVLSLTAVLVVHKLLSCLPHCATPQTSCGDALVGILLTSKQSTGHITARKELEIITMLCLNECGSIGQTWEQFCIPRPDLSSCQTLMSELNTQTAETCNRRERLGKKTWKEDFIHFFFPKALPVCWQQEIYKNAACRQNLLQNILLGVSHRAQNPPVMSLQGHSLIQNGFDFSVCCTNSKQAGIRW